MRAGLLLPCVTWILCGFVPWVHAEKLTMDSAVELSEVGLRFTPFEQIPMLPKPTPGAVLFTVTHGDSSRQVEAFRAGDLWRDDQLKALFTNHMGRVQVAAMEYPLPAGLSYLTDGFVVRSEYDRVRQGQDVSWSDDSIQQWIETFTGMSVTGYDSVPRAHALRYPCREYSLSSNQQRAKAYLLKMTRRNETRYVLLSFEFRAFPPFENQEAAILRCLRSVTASAVKKPVKRADMRHQKFSTLTRNGKASKEFLSTKRRVIDNINALNDWWFVEMPHYILVSNLTPNNRFLVERIQEDVERLRDAFSILFPPVKEIREVSVVRVFNTREEYVDYVGRDYQWTLGLWMPSKRELVISPSRSGTQGSKGSKAKKEILDTAYHEAFHQYVHYALNQVSLPLWFNEGHACLFEAAVFSRARPYVVLEENESRADFLRQVSDFGYETDVVQVMSMSRDEFYLEGLRGDGVDRMRAQHYASAWAITYFLRKGAPALFPEKGYGAILLRIVEFLLDHDEDVNGAVQYALEGVDRSELQHDFEAFWKSRSMRNKAKKYHLFRPAM